MRGMFIHNHRSVKVINDLISDDVLLVLGQHIEELDIEKSRIGWNLEALEAATLGLEERESDRDDSDSGSGGSDSAPI